MFVKLPAQGPHRANSQCQMPSSASSAAHSMRSALFRRRAGVCALGSTEAPWPLALFSPSPRWRRSAAPRRDPGEPSEGSGERSPHEAGPGPDQEAAAAPPHRHPPPGARDTTPGASQARRGLAQGPSRGLEWRPQPPPGRGWSGPEKEGGREPFKWGRRESCGAGRGRAAAPGACGLGPPLPLPRPSPPSGAPGGRRGCGDSGRGRGGSGRGLRGLWAVKAKGPRSRGDGRAGSSAGRRGCEELSSFPLHRALLN